MKNNVPANNLAKPARPPCNIIVAGLGGQGVLTATDILAEVARQAGFDVKKSEIKGMSQRGGSVACDVRFGAEILSPMVPAGEADFLLALEAAAAGFLDLARSSAYKGDTYPPAIDKLNSLTSGYVMPEDALAKAIGDLKVKYTLKDVDLAGRT